MNISTVMTVLAAVFLIGCSNDNSGIKEFYLPEDSSQGAIYYVDTTSLRESDGKVIVTLVGEFDSTDPDQKILLDAGAPMLSTTSTTFRFECDKREYEFLYILSTYVDGHKRRHEPPAGIRTVIPNSRDESVMNYACSNI